MTEKEFFVQTIGDELPRFEKVFKAIPSGKAHFRPHKKSRSAQELLVSMAGETSVYPKFLKTGIIDFSKVDWGAIKTVPVAIALFTKSLKAGEKTAAAMTEKDWKSKAEMKTGDKVEWTTTKGMMAWGFLLDLIHHRGQLSVYLRPMGAKVPAIYGPSADENG